MSIYDLEALNEELGLVDKQIEESVETLADMRDKGMTVEQIWSMNDRIVRRIEELLQRRIGIAMNIRWIDEEFADLNAPRIMIDYFKKKVLRTFSEGADTIVYKEIDRSGHEGGAFVVKTFDRETGRRGFEEEMKQRFDKVFTSLVREFDEYIVGQLPVRSPFDGAKYHLKQEFVPTADPKSLFQYLPIDIESDRLKEALQDFVARLKDNFIRFKAGDESAVLLDMMMDNFVLSKDEEHVFYIDCEAVLGGEETKHKDEWYFSAFAMMEVLGGRKPKELMDDDFYKRFFEENAELFTSKTGDAEEIDIEDFYWMLAEINPNIDPAG